ncbi:MAG: CoA-binding protein [Ignavibacteriae bacterium]|nr:CoA-binding protein [Ignavibacteriota bacterium]
MNTKEILEKYRKIAIIGFSDNTGRDSHKVAFYMLNNGYKVFGVNPKLDGQNINGIQCYKTLNDIPEQIEIVNIFRLSIAVLPIVQEILKLNYKPKVIWTQFGIFNEEAKKLALENGFEYIENKCILVEHSKI